MSVALSNHDFLSGAARVRRSAPALAAEPRVTAVLSNSETDVGQPVQLEIQVTGASNPKPPGEITVDGLEIQSAGTSRQYQMQNFDISYSFTFTYTVMPHARGAFHNSGAGSRGGRTDFAHARAGFERRRAIRTLGGAPAAAAAMPNIDPSQIGFVEMILPKSVAYVGEMVPAQIQLGLNMRAPVESLGAGIQIAGQGFTTQKMTEPRQTIETINGRSYQIFIVKTAISPARSGQARDRAGGDQSHRARAARRNAQSGDAARRAVRRSVL